MPAVHDLWELPGKRDHLEVHGETLNDNLTCRAITMLEPVA